MVQMILMIFLMTLINIPIYLKKFGTHCSVIMLLYHTKNTLSMGPRHARGFCFFRNTQGVRGAFSLRIKDKHFAAVWEISFFPEVKRPAKFFIKFLQPGQQLSGLRFRMTAERRNGMHGNHRTKIQNRAPPCRHPSRSTPGRNL